jgi:hypothetical protein
MTDHISPIIIICEKAIETEDKLPRSELPGIIYAKYLRRVEKRRNPIIFTSFLAANSILKKNGTAIITALGHSYLQIPYTDEELEEKLKTAKPLSDIQLIDIIINFCQLKSAVRESFHAFKGRIRSIKGEKVSTIDVKMRYEAELLKYEKELLIDAGEYPQVIHEYRRIIDKFRTSPDIGIDELLDIPEETFVRFIPSEEDSNEEPESTPKPWKILFLDDRPWELEPVIEQLKIKKIDADRVTTVHDARNLLSNDFLNRYTLVVSDYRLLEDEDDWIKPKMQSEQGYDFLLWVADQMRFTAMVALSGLSKWFLMESFRKRQVNVKVYSKNNLSGSGVKLFTDDLEYLGNRQFEALVNQPQATNWHQNSIEKTLTGKNTEQGRIKNYALKPYYIFHRNHPSYEVNENNLNKIAEKVAREIEFALDEKSDNFAPIISLSGKILTNMKGKMEEEYGLFQEKLLFRRVFYYLLLKGFDKDAIIKMMQRGEFGQEKEMSESLLKQVPSYLAIQTISDIPNRLLVEEIFFLQNYMMLPVYEAAQLMDQTYSIINEVINKHLSGQAKVKQELLRYVCRGDIKAVSINETHVILTKLANLINPREFMRLLEEIEEILDILCKNFSKFRLLEQSRKKLIELKEKVHKAEYKAC